MYDQRMQRKAMRDELIEQSHKHAHLPPRNFLGDARRIWSGLPHITIGPTKDYFVFAYPISIACMHYKRRKELYRVEDNS